MMLTAGPRPARPSSPASAADMSPVPGSRAISREAV